MYLCHGIVPAALGVLVVLDDICGLLILSLIGYGH